MFEEDIFKDAKYCVPCNKFYITNFCPFCTPKKESRVESQELGVRTLNSGLKTQDSQPKTQNSQLDFKVEELSLEIERLRHENKEKKEKIAKEKELELKFNILADKFERLSKKEKEYREQAFQAQSVVRDNGNDTQTELLKERIKELNAELEQLQQRNEEKDQHVLQSTAEASKLSGVVEQQKDELERLWFDMQEKDRVIMQISLTLSSAISQALTQRGQSALGGQEFTTSHSDPRLSVQAHKSDRGSTIKRNIRSVKTLYAVLGGLNAVIIGYLVSTFLYKRDIVNLIIEFFK